MGEGHGIEGEKGVETSPGREGHGGGPRDRQGRGTAPRLLSSTVYAGAGPGGRMRKGRVAAMGVYKALRVRNPGPMRTVEDRWQ